MIVTAWSHYEGGGMGGISPAGEREVRDRLERHGYVVLTDSRQRPPLNHRMIGCGVGHDDAQFAETGASMAAYYENGAAHGGRWFDDSDLASPFSTGVKHYGMARQPGVHYCGAPSAAAEALRGAA